ncbi:MAG: MFS transporter [Desulfuromonas sp.]|nr:MAG: MFS transporter [Desulfuromonas sp.]
MAKREICPLYKSGEQGCETGTGYISSHDVSMIIQYCTASFCSCPKYEQTKVRHDLPMATVSGNPQRPNTHQRPLIKPFKVNWPLPFQIRTMSARYGTQTIHSKEEPMSTNTIKNKGWSVVIAGLGINLALGILYTWSIFKGAIVDSITAGGPFTWDKTSVNDPYGVACLMFALAMIIGGKVLDKFGPKVTAIIGGLLVGAGFILVSQSTAYSAWIAGFGVLTGLGLGFGYCAATPPALKWFSSAKTGMIAGIVVAGFGLASIYIAPLAKYLLAAYGLQQSMLYFGIAFTIVVCGFALMLQNPPEGYVPAGPAKSTAAAPSNDMTPLQMLKTPSFYTLWTLFFIGAGAGLMVIGSAKGLAKASMGDMAYVAVMLMAVGNASGRVIAGLVSDKFGRAKTLAIMLSFQAVLMFSATTVLNGGNPVLVTLLVCFMVFNYGTNLALFPSFAKDYYGFKNYGMNYGILFSAWGVGGIVLSRVAEMLKTSTGSFSASFIAAGVMLTAGAIVTMTLTSKPATVATEALATDAEEYEEEDLAID